MESRESENVLDTSYFLFMNRKGTMPVVCSLINSYDWRQQELVLSEGNSCTLRTLNIILRIRRVTISIFNLFLLC